MQVQKLNVEMEVQVPDGYELTGEYRPPREREQFVVNGHVKDAETDYRFYPYPIVRPQQVPQPGEFWTFIGDPTIKVVIVKKSSGLVGFAYETNIYPIDNSMPSFCTRWQKA